MLLVFTMENVGESGRKRKMKFEAIELEVLVEEANKHIHELQQRIINISRRNGRKYGRISVTKSMLSAKQEERPMKLRGDGKM